MNTTILVSITSRLLITNQSVSMAQYTDCMQAEIQNISADGVISIHTRSLKYGKLENGQLAIVPASLIKRLPQVYCIDSYL